jgi:DNA polymerase-3 subunit epsilon
MNHPQPKIELHATVLDTLTLAREIHPGQRNSLDALCKRYSIDASKRDVHGALIDSELLANVYLAMTGGQAALLLDEGSPRLDGGAALGRDTPRPGLAPAHSVGAGPELVVIKASKEEAAAHEAILKKIRKSGACVWDFN